ncbi:hypothetical protein GCM10022384_07650 [Streptomyces marokkonensis]|uniref:Uncharacterized protein n=1 Tax=Streptomyces marokkonensis TaxID=324855 RepID=A0ABP7P0F7_9ACTN
MTDQTPAQQITRAIHAKTPPTGRTDEYRLGWEQALDAAIDAVLAVLSSSPDQAVHPGAVREQLLAAIDDTRCEPLGYAGKAELLAAYDASRTPADQGALRNRIAAAVRDAACDGKCGKTEEQCFQERIQPVAWHHGRLVVVEAEPEQIADVVLAVLPAPADQATTWSPCSPEWLRAMPAGACSWAPRKAGDGATVSHYHPALPAPADRGAVLREAAAALAEDDYLLAAEELRRMADETAATETQAVALTPAERTMLGYALDQAQERIWSEGGFTEEDQAAVDSLRRLTAEQSAAGARQDGAQR